MALLPPVDVFATEWSLEELFADHDAFVGVPAAQPDRYKKLDKDVPMQHATMFTRPQITELPLQLAVVDIHGKMLCNEVRQPRQARGMAMLRL